MADKPKGGGVFNQKDVQFTQDPPKHLNTRGWPLVNPRAYPARARVPRDRDPCRTAARSRTCIRDEDHVFYVRRGRATAKVGDDVFDVAPGDALYVPKNTTHDFTITGGEVFRIAVVFAPGRAFWTAQQ